MARSTRILQLGAALLLTALFGVCSCSSPRTTEAPAAASPRTTEVPAAPLPREIEVPAAPFPRTTEVPAAGTCGTRVAMFEARMDAMPEQSWRAVPDHLDPARGVGGVNAAAEAPEARLGRNGAITLDGRAVTLTSLVEDLATLDRNWGFLHPGHPRLPRSLAIWANRGAHLSELRPLLDATPDYRHDLLWVDTTPVPSPRPCPASLGRLCSELHSGDPRSRTTAGGRAVTTTSGTCMPLVRALGEFASVYYTDRRAFLRSRTPAALRECECQGVDFDGYEFTTLVMLGLYDTRVRSAPLGTLSAADEALTVEQWVARASSK